VERARLAVALLFDPATSAFLDALRVAMGERRPERIPAHVTLVPPVDAPAADLVGIWEDLRAAVVDSPPALELHLGPVATFAPDVATIHLDVHGVDEADDVALRALRQAVRIPALRRRDRHGFHPHVTLTTRAPSERIEAAMVALDGLGRRATVDRVTLLRHSPGPPTRWHPVGEVGLGARPAVVRGAERLEVAVSPLRDPTVEAFWGRVVAASPRELPSPPDPGPASWTVAARAGREVVGAAECIAHPAHVDVGCLAVAPSRWRQGVGRLLLDEVASLALSRGAERIEVLPSAGLPEAVAAAWGLEPLRGGGWRRPV